MVLRSMSPVRSSAWTCWPTANRMVTPSGSLRGADSSPASTQATRYRSASTSRIFPARPCHAAASNGAFDPTVGAVLAKRGVLPAAGYGDRRTKSKPSFLPQREDEGEHADARPDWCDVDLARRQVRFSRPLRLDFGGIAKGFA